MMDIRIRMGKGFLGAALCVAAMTVGAREWALDLTAPAAAGTARLASFASSSTDAQVIRQHRLAAGAAKISGLAVGDEIAFSLFADEELTVTLVEETPALAGRAFLGRIDNALGALGCVVLETDVGVTLDVTDFEHDRVWQVVSDDTGVTVREVEPAKNQQCGNDTLTPPTVESFAVASATATTASPTSASSSTPTVDILINYDTDAAAWAKSNGGGLTNFAETCIQKMNTALANTGLTDYFRFRLVGIYEVGGSAGGSISDALQYATYSGTLNGVSWAGVQEERDRVHADIVCTLCDNGSAYGTVGVGWSLQSDGDAASCGFNACLIRSVAQSHTMTHEVGHNMGAGHSDKMADSDNCGPQYYSYSSGYYFYVGSTGYYTIMAYNADGYGKYYTSVPYFSSPNYYYQGVAVGTSVNDNTQTLQRNYALVADNRKAPYVSAEIGQGFEAEGYTWTTDGTYPWSRVTDSSSDGVDSSCSSLTPTSGGTTSWTETKVKGPATLSFKRLFKSYGGQFLVTCDGDTLYSYGSSSQAITEYSWVTVSGLSIPSGVHTVRLAHINNNSSYYTPANAVWIDQLAFTGGSPVSDEDEGSSTTTTEVPVPYDWLATYYPGESTSSYETLSASKGANGYSVWESYVAGLNPTNAASVFTATITFVNGVPVIGYDPVLSTAETAKRTYTTYGKKNLTDTTWTAVSSGATSKYKFFTVKVDMK